MAGELKLDPTTGDLLLNDLGTLEQVYDAEATAQEIQGRLELFRGEFFADLRVGVPYYQEILVKGGSMGRVRSIISQAIRSVPGVVDAQVMIAFDANTRSATVTWQARRDDGAVIRSEDFRPLVLV